MFCSNCGTQVSSDANFCSKCGKSQKQTANQEESSDTRWEICEIASEYRTGDVLWGLLGKNEYERFIAMAIGHYGKYLEAASEWFPINPDDEHLTRRAHNNLIKILFQNGWEPVESSTVVGFNNKFRRRESPSSKGLSSAKSPLIEKIQSILLHGDKINAIKVYREETGAGLKEAKDAVESIERGENVHIPKKA